MKKLLLFGLVAVMIFSLFACKDNKNDPTTESGTTTADNSTTGEVTTTEPQESNTSDTSETLSQTESSETESSETESSETESSETESSETESSDTDSSDTEDDPAHEGEDISALLMTWGNGQKFAFEIHGDLDGKVAAVINISDTELFGTLIQSGAPVDGYVWKVTINDTQYTVENFSIIGSYVRLDVESDGFHATTTETTYDVSLTIYNSDGDEIYYCDPLGTLAYKLGEMIEDENRTGTAVEGITPVSGPNAGAGEGYERLFDGKIATKLCTNETTPIIFMTAEAVTLDSYSFVGANDAAGSRKFASWTLYGSTDQETWVKLDERTGSEISNQIFTEYNYKINSENQGPYTYYKVEYQKEGDLIQYSRLLLFTAE